MPIQDKFRKKRGFLKKSPLALFRFLLYHKSTVFSRQGKGMAFLVNQEKRRVFWTQLLRFLFTAAAGLFLLWSCLPLLSGIVNAGVMVSIPGFLALFLIGLFWRRIYAVLQRIWRTKGGRVVMAVLFCLLSALIVLFIVASSVMLHAAAKQPEENATVLVLGAAINGDRPSRMLADRLNTAVNYLEKNPDSVCIVSGGQGSDEETTEAQVMFDYLVEKGIAPSRIFQEDRSTNTEENIRFSREIIEREGLNPHVVIATQEFHQYRAQSLAKKEGLTQVGPATCRTPLQLLECYWVREFAAVCRLWILGR